MSVTKEGLPMTDDLCFPPVVGHSNIIVQSESPSTKKQNLKILQSACLWQGHDESISWENGQHSFSC